jgi:hypothetical protein
MSGSFSFMALPKELASFTKISHQFAPIKKGTRLSAFAVSK